MAAVMPAMTPCNSQPLGSSDGVRELRPASSAPVVPLQVYRGSQRRRLRSGRSTDGTAGDGCIGRFSAWRGLVVGSVAMSPSAPTTQTLEVRPGPQLVPGG